MDFIFDLAVPADDPALRRLLQTNPVPGQVTLTYEREPDYFLGCPVMGPFYQILVARPRPDGDVIGAASRSTRPLFVNGQNEAVGYIGQLRVDRRHRGRWVVSGGFRLLRQLHADGRVAGYITTIIEGNVQAQGVLVKRARRHFPAYQIVDRLCTAAVILRRPRRSPASSYAVSRASAAETSEIVAFLNQHGPAKQFFPVYTEADFDGNPVTRDFCIEDFMIARRRGRIAGVVGLWDQSGYKQTVVQAYNGRLRRLRPFYNAGLRLIGAQPLTPPGQKINFAYASFICVADNQPDIFAALLHQLYNLAAERGYAYLMVGLSERDPLLAVARRYIHIPYYSRLYTVCWQEDLGFHEKLDGRIPYVEIATL